MNHHHHLTAHSNQTLDGAYCEMPYSSQQTQPPPPPPPQQQQQPQPASQQQPQPQPSQQAYHHPISQPMRIDQQDQQLHLGSTNRQSFIGLAEVVNTTICAPLSYHHNNLQHHHHPTNQHQHHHHHPHHHQTQQQHLYDQYPQQQISPLNNQQQHIYIQQAGQQPHSPQLNHLNNSPGAYRASPQHVHQLTIHPQQLHHHHHHQQQQQQSHPHHHHHHHHQQQQHHNHHPSLAYESQPYDTHIQYSPQLGHQQIQAPAPSSQLQSGAHQYNIVQAARPVAQVHPQYHPHTQYADSVYMHQQQAAIQLDEFGHSQMSAYQPTGQIIEQTAANEFSGAGKMLEQNYSQTQMDLYPTIKQQQQQQQQQNPIALAAPEEASVAMSSYEAQICDQLLSPQSTKQSATLELPAPETAGGITMVTQQAQLKSRSKSDLEVATVRAACGENSIEPRRATHLHQRSLSTTTSYLEQQQRQQPPQQQQPRQQQQPSPQVQSQQQQDQESSAIAVIETQPDRGRQQQPQNYLDMRSWSSVPQDWLDTICRHLIEHMERFGICVIDNFLGRIKGESILKEVKQLYNSGHYARGKLVSSNKLNQRNLAADTGVIRNDRVIWIDGCEVGCSEINNLIQTLCSVITNSARLSLYSNNGLDKIVINKRTKAHVACYPGNGTRYIKHVDNPNGDGRVITSIYYLNKDWNTKRDGGLLRMFPAGIDEVANIEPLFDRALFFWSDRRNPHEVLPAYKDRFAITVWYIGETRT